MANPPRWKIALNIEAIGARRGGAEKYAGILARWLAAAGHDIHIFARSVDARELPPGAKLTWIDGLPWLGLGWLKAFQFGRESKRAISRQRFDLVIGFVKVWYQHAYIAVGGCHRASLVYNSKRFRSPITRSFWWLTKYLSPKQWVFAWIDQRQFSRKHAPVVIAPSRMVARHFQQFHDVPEDRILVVPNAPDPATSNETTPESRESFRLLHDFEKDDVVALFLARNYELKGLEPLLRAFALVARSNPNARLVVCGNSRDLRYRWLAKRLGIAESVRFLGFIDDVARVMAGSDLFVFPTFYDPCSLVVPEAMLAGLPVITTEQNGAAELLDEGVDGYVVSNPWATDELADRMNRLMGDADRRLAMGAAAARHALEHTLEARSVQMLDALAFAVACRTRTPRLREAA